MRLNFVTGLIVGILLAAVLVITSGFNQGPALLQPEFNAVATTSQVTVTSSSTTASFTTQSGAGAAISPPTRSNLSASAGTLSGSISNAATNASPAYLPSIAVQPPSNLAVLVKQPTAIPLLLLPILLALALGFALFRATRPTE